MPDTPSSAALAALDHRLAAILMALRPLIAQHFLRHPWVPNAVAVPLWNRIGCYARRLSRLIALFAAGNLPGPRRRRPASANLAERTRPPHPPIPRRHGWMLAALGWRVAVYRNQLEALLATPELAEFLAAAPSARRLLRPVCHMLGVRHASLARLPSRSERPGMVPAPAARRRPIATHPEPDDAPALAAPPAQPLCPRLRARWPFRHLPENRFA